VPAHAEALPRARWAHSSDDNDYAALAGLRVGVVGAGASAMDSAATALEAGAAHVHLLVRRADLPRVNKGKGVMQPRLRARLRAPARRLESGASATTSTRSRCRRRATARSASRATPNAHFHLGAAIEGAEERRGALQVRTSAGPIELDFLIFATGFSIDWRQRPMLRHIAPCIRIWKDRYAAPPGQDDPELEESPDLGASFEFQPRAGADCPGLDRVHCLSYPATLSLGVITGDIPAISDGALQLADKLAGAAVCRRRRACTTRAWSVCASRRSWRRVVAEPCRAPSRAASPLRDDAAPTSRATAMPLPTSPTPT
jgi:cation diffusion facilitator CzcD-associated flavoprotein CzcO